MHTRTLVLQSASARALPSSTELYAVDNAHNGTVHVLGATGLAILTYLERRLHENEWRPLRVTVREVAAGAGVANAGLAARAIARLAAQGLIGRMSVQGSHAGTTIYPLASSTRPPDPIARRRALARMLGRRWRAILAAAAQVGQVAAAAVSSAAVHVRELAEPVRAYVVELAARGIRCERPRYHRPYHTATECMACEAQR